MTLRVLNLGAGVQSSCLLLRACRGEFEKPDCAIFADTQWERGEVYAHLDWLEGLASAAGIAVHRVTAGPLRQHATEGVPKKTKPGERHWVSLPIYTVAPDGSKGIVDERQCTRDYKIVPIERKIRELLGLRRGQHWPKDPVVEQWFGITGDETRRIRNPKHRWGVNRYPFVFDQLRYRGGRYECRTSVVWSRSDCLAWLSVNHPSRRIPRSACIGCPYHDNAEWAAIKERPDEWADAVDADRIIRRTARDRRTSSGFLHRDCVPLEEADLTIKKKGMEQRSVFALECQGMCGV